MSCFRGFEMNNNCSDLLFDFDRFCLIWRLLHSWGEKLTSDIALIKISENGPGIKNDNNSLCCLPTHEKRGSSPLSQGNYSQYTYVLCDKLWCWFQMVKSGCFTDWTRFVDKQIKVLENLLPRKFSTFTSDNIHLPSYEHISVHNVFLFDALFKLYSLMYHLDGEV